MQTSTIRLERDPALALVVRIFVGGVTERWGLPEQIRDDLRIAASELFSDAVEAGGDGPVGFVLSADDTEVSLRTDGVDPRPGGSTGEAAWDDRFGLVRTLFPQAEVGGAVRIRVPVPLP